MERIREVWKKVKSAFLIGCQHLAHAASVALSVAVKAFKLTFNVILVLVNLLMVGIIVSSAKAAHDTSNALAFVGWTNAMLWYFFTLVLVFDSKYRVVIKERSLTRR